MCRIEIEPESALNSFGFAGASEITIKGGQTVKALVEFPPGHPKNPITDEQLTEKFSGLACPVVGESVANDIRRIVASLETLDSVTGLMKLLVFALPPREGITKHHPGP